MVEINAKELKKELHIHESLGDKLKALFAKKPEPSQKKTEKRKNEPRKTDFKELLTHHFQRAGFMKPLIFYQKIFFKAVGSLSLLVFFGFIIKFFIEDQLTLGYFFQLLLVGLPLLMAATAFVLGLGAFLLLDVRIYQRRISIEEVLPDFLQLAASNIRSGMTVDKALWMAVRPQFGVLAKEIETVAKQTMSGEELDKALVEFAGKYDSPMLNRSIHLIVEGLNAGGELGGLLDKIALDLQETQSMIKEMAANVTSYVMFISFATLMAAPFMYGLSLQLLHITTSLMGNLDLSSSGGTSIGGGGGISADDFVVFALVSLAITSFFSGCIISTIKKGNIRSGYRSIPIYIIISIILFYGTSSALGGLFANMF
ncbi:type II secretion system F family protein [Candidatus Woesearchaeota archaeon]|nr:type II secretion system F family protein [Candidatus Woesearchaeota archaeon]